MNPHDAIEAIRTAHGPDLVILGHHYQSSHVIEHADHAGDSLELARLGASLKARRIVLCGVRFMAETAAVLKQPGQSVYTPDDSAGCAMADMADPGLVEDVLLQMQRRSDRRIVPLAYVNTSLEVKALVGEHGGALCTSANAAAMMRWALARGDAVFFLPDRNLGNNTADALGLPVQERHTLNVDLNGSYVDYEAAGRARLILWPGFCPVHERFTPAHARAMREKNPGALLAVHPECLPEVVALADAVGSTSFLIRYAAEAAPGATLIIGTEVHLVRRLAERHKERGVTILPLLPSSCVNMCRITKGKLLDLLRRIDTARPLEVSEDLAAKARLAFERMFNA